MTFINIQCNWSKSPAMNCWVFLLMLTFERWPLNSHSLDHLDSLHRLDKVHQECPTQHVRFRFFRDIQTPNRISPLYRILFYHIFQAVNVCWQQIGGARIGSHISPSLSNFAVTFVERSWTQVFKEVLDPPTFPFCAIRFSFLRRRFKSLPYKSHFEMTFINFQWNWRKSPRMNCWFFLLILTFRTVTYKLPQPRPLGFPPPVGRSPPGVSNIALPLSNFPGNPGTQQNFPIVQASLFCHFFRFSTVGFSCWPKNSHNLDHLFLLHRLDEVHQVCPTQHFSFRISQEIQAPNRFFLLSRRPCFATFFK